MSPQPGKKPHGQLPQERQGEKQPITDHAQVREVLDRDLKSDARREEDAHEPLEQALELRHESHVHVVIAAEYQP